MAKPQKRITGSIGEIIESPIIANFREGLNVLEYFISTHGARKGSCRYRAETADAGYLTRRLVDVAQDVIISEPDCGTVRGIHIRPLKDGEEVIESLQDRIVGRVTLQDVFDPIQPDRIIVEAGREIEEESAKLVEDAGIESVHIRSVLTCESRRGVCAACYGRNLATNKMVQLGEAVGVIAAQSIGEPGTQLTMRTFHIGGTAARIAEASQVRAKTDGHIEFVDVRTIVREDGQTVVVSRDGEVKVFRHAEAPARYIQSAVRGIDARSGRRERLQGRPALCAGNAGFSEQRHCDLWNGEPYINEILSESSGTVQYQDIVEGVSMREELDEITGLMQLWVIEQREKTLLPLINVLGKAGKKRATYSIPTGAYLEVRDGDQVTAGVAIAKIPRDISKTRDITGGLPRVAELFEVRKPRDPAVISKIDGSVEYGKIIRGNTQIFVKAADGEVLEELVPHGAHARS